MIIYLADASGKHFEAGERMQPRKINLLASYHYYKTTDFDDVIAKYFAYTPPGIFADSGAFSGKTIGVDISVDEYAKWVKRWRHYFNVYCNLDVIGDPGATYKNQKYLEDKHGLTPLPVFHFGADFKYLEQLVGEYPYIALGGMVPHMGRTERIMRWLIQCFKIAKGQSVFHGLGATNWTVITSLPWRSVDSSSWTAGFRFGRVPIYDIKRCKIVSVNLGDMRGAQRYKNDLARYGIKPEQIGNRDQNTRQINAYIAAMSYMDLQDWLTHRFGDYTIYLAEDMKSLKSTLGSFQSNE